MGVHISYPCFYTNKWTCNFCKIDRLTPLTERFVHPQSTWSVQVKISRQVWPSPVLGCAVWFAWLMSASALREGLRNHAACSAPHCAVLLRWRCVRARSTPFNESFHLTSDRRYQINATNHFYINIWSESNIEKRYISFMSFIVAMRHSCCHGEHLRFGVARLVPTGGWAWGLRGMLVFLHLC